MVAKRTWEQYVTPFHCISGDFVLVVPVVSFWFSGSFGGSGGSIPAVSFRCFGF